MGFKHYDRILVFRLLLIIATAIALGFLYHANKNWFFLGGVGFIEFLFVIDLIRFQNKTNKQISYFIQSIKNEDTTLHFPVKTGNAIMNELHERLNELNLIIQDVKVKNKIQEQYFSEIIQNIGTGILVHNENGFVSDVNPAALELLGMSVLTHLKQLNRVDSDFNEQLQRLANNQKQMLTLKKLNDQVQIVTRCSVINLKDEKVKLITLQDIRGELERKEIDSWIKLIRVMSHEIMNSLAPISSIAQSLKSIWKSKNEELLDVDVQSTIGGLEVIGERGEALKQFVQSYRIFTHVPQPNYKDVSVKSLAESLSILTSPYKIENQVAINFLLPKADFHVSIDEQLLIQVIINLVKNSVEALSEIDEPIIKIEITKSENAVLIIKVSDNGPGIPDDVRDQIFVPFFTTKSGGTGVGLSHSRQIIRAMGGTISCNTQKGETAFTIVL